MILSAFILAAGLGERLLPITHHIPKPLLPILGKPILQSVLEKVIALPINNIGINLHHKRTIIENWIKQSEYFENITLFPEDPILGTGGALKNAEVFLEKGPFLVHNADIISDIDLEELIEFHFSAGNLATLAVHNHPEFNRLVLDENAYLKEIVKHPHPYPPPSRGREVKENAPTSRGREVKENAPTSRGRKSSGIPPSYSNSLPLKIPPSLGGRGLGGGGYKILAFTGIAVYQPEFLQFLPKGNSSVVDAWFNALSAGYRIGTLDVTGCYWTDIGTPSSYAKAVINELGKNGEMVYIHPSFSWCKNIEIDGYVVIEETSNPPSPPLRQGGKGEFIFRNCIVLPSIFSATSSPSLWQREDRMDFSHELKNSSFENCILGPGFKIDLSESDFYTTDAHGNFLIGTGGSDRKYFRVKKNRHSAVLMQCAEHDPDFQRHIEYTTFFRTYAVPVPELIRTEPHCKTVVFEDLGDLSLYNWLKCPRSENQVEEIYRKALDILIPMHTAATVHVHECPLLNSRIFDYEHLRWETSYFLERFVQGVKKIGLKDRATLESEFHNLASAVDSFPKTIVHRDFQSQNIMITKGGIPRVLDYQSARIGPPAYDIVSLLWDPYYRLEYSLRERLLDYYINKVMERMSFVREFRATILPCRLQRHMQALGAYGFLSTVKGKTYFMNHIPEGVRLLKEDVSQPRNDYPALHRLVMEM